MTTLEDKKYKNKEGIELSFTGKDTTSVLVKEVIQEAIKICDTCNFWDKHSLRFAIRDVRKFLTTNFDITDTNK